MLLRIDHIDLRVSDLKAAEDFFHSLGFRTIRKMGPPRNSIETALPGEGQVVFEVRQAKEGQSCGIDHVGFAIDSEQAVDELEEKGIVFTGKGKFVAATGRTVSNFIGPDKSKWQMTLAETASEKG